MYEISKIFHKGSVWSHHGRRDNRGIVRRLNREAAARQRQKAARKGKMYASIRELFSAR